MTEVHGYAALNEKDPLKPFHYQLSELGPEQVDIQVEYCGICHSDLSMVRNEWGMTKYPFVPGHEVVGTITAIGQLVKGLQV